jgi:hypothetical protein
MDVPSIAQNCGLIRGMDPSLITRTAWPSRKRPQSTITVSNGARIGEAAENVSTENDFSDAEGRRTSR